MDVCGVLTEQPDYDHAKNYWKVLKHRLIKEGNESVTNCNQLKLVSPREHGDTRTWGQVPVSHICDETGMKQYLSPCLIEKNLVVCFFMRIFASKLQEYGN